MAHSLSITELRISLTNEKYCEDGHVHVESFLEEKI
jgi:hypothetical protein